ncbi:1,3-beta-glucan synthase component GLS1 [Cordyceps militaris]|uniref:1,3-beta-glucan synthase component GLS1 n=1 Tax=Cordyceps militaris TaxID=73501 RepID=A0A2H4SP13_CORMI|nr:1,3-beta-glucan synthase component GLS1 [Cordyceps militaris]
MGYIVPRMILREGNLSLALARPDRHRPIAALNQTNQTCCCHCSSPLHHSNVVCPRQGDAPVLEKQGCALYGEGANSFRLGQQPITGKSERDRRPGSSNYRRSSAIDFSLLPAIPIYLFRQESTDKPELVGRGKHFPLEEYVQALKKDG